MVLIVVPSPPCCPHCSCAHCAKSAYAASCSSHSSNSESERNSLVAMPHDSALFSLLCVITVCLHTARLYVYMLWLTMIMQRPAIARRAIAIELFRRLTQMEGERRRSHSSPVPHPRSAHVVHKDKKPLPLRFDWQCHQSGTLIAQSQLPLPKQDAPVEATTGRATSPNYSDGADGTSLQSLQRLVIEQLKG